MRHALRWLACLWFGHRWKTAELPVTWPETYRYRIDCERCGDRML